MLARATLMHDENNYLQEIDREHPVSPRRQRGLRRVRQGRALYAAKVPSLNRTRRPPQAFDDLVLCAAWAPATGAIDEETLRPASAPPDPAAISPSPASSASGI